MTKRAAEEAPPSMDSCTTGPNFLGCDRDQVAELLSQEERIPHHGDGDTKKSSAEIIGADISSLKREKLKALLRQCVRDIIPGVDEMPTRARSMHLMSQLSNKKPSISVTNKEVKDDIQLLMKSDPGLFKGIVKKHTLNDMQQQAEQLLDTVATSCSGRPMSQEEKRDLQKSIKALPRGNLKRVAEIIRDHYVASGKEFSDEVTVNLEEEDNVMLWRLHFYVAAVKSARKLAMTKRAAEEATPSTDSSTTGPNFLGCYRDQVAELLSQEERLPHHEDGDTKKPSTEIIGAGISSLKREKLKALLRQCVTDLIPGVDEMQSRARSMLLMSQLSNKKPSISVTNEEVEDDIQLLMKSDPRLFKEIVKKHTDDVLTSLNNMQQQAEKLLDNVATSCRPMSRDEKRDLQRSIKELPGGNLKRIAEIIKDHHAASGKAFSDEVTVNLEEEDNVMLWRLHFYVAAVKSARKLAS
ncbi:hypothetical protein DY000_02033742 [Brassica cretica]|uniref:NET domain-containing protein n=1 Tax=Brassica cretica TaxID=69181 RepID=A0ABQ7DXL3_BRACR|nr:hypothetical protein DY000_02033742 [Brassica cretica]